MREVWGRRAPRCTVDVWLWLRGVTLLTTPLFEFAASEERKVLQVFHTGISTSCFQRLHFLAVFRWVFFFLLLFFRMKPFVYVCSLVASRFIFFFLCCKQSLCYYFYKPLRRLTSSTTTVIWWTVTMAASTDTIWQLRSFSFCLLKGFVGIGLFVFLISCIQDQWLLTIHTNNNPRQYFSVVFSKL